LAASCAFCVHPLQVRREALLGGRGLRGRLVQQQRAEGGPQPLPLLAVDPLLVVFQRLVERVHLIHVLAREARLQPCGVDDERGCRLDDDRAVFERRVGLECPAELLREVLGLADVAEVAGDEVQRRRFALLERREGHLLQEVRHAHPAEVDAASVAGEPVVAGRDLDLRDGAEGDHRAAVGRLQVIGHAIDLGRLDEVGGPALVEVARVVHPHDEPLNPRRPRAAAEQLPDGAVARGTLQGKHRRGRGVRADAGLALARSRPLGLPGADHC
jgi:hypothetical protein